MTQPTVRLTCSVDPIAEAGNPTGQVVPIEPAPPYKPQRLGFMSGKGKIPDDFDTMYADEIARMFNGED